MQGAITNNNQAQFAVSEVEQYALEALNAAFPSIIFRAFTSLDKDDRGLFGIVIDKDSRAYSFIIPEATKNPILQRTIIND